MKIRSINESFSCLYCNKKVHKLEFGGCRNHCPFCLFSLHLDDQLPGDRAAQCNGLMEPIGLEYNKKKGYMIIFKCRKCKKVVKNKRADDDNYDKILELCSKAKYE